MTPDAGSGSSGPEGDEGKDFVIEPPATEMVTLTKRDVEKVAGIFEHRRKIRPAKVNKLRKILESGKPFYMPLILFKMRMSDGVGGWKWVWMLLDGNHRLTALVQFFEKFPLATVKVNVMRVVAQTSARDKDELWEKARTLYDELNINVTRETLSDIIHWHQDEYPVLQMLWKKFPVPVVLYTPERDRPAVYFMSMVKAYISRYRPYLDSYRTDAVLDKVRRWGDEEYNELTDFMSAFIEVFGAPTSGLLWSSFVGLQALTRVYFCNLQNLGRAEIVQRWKLNVARDATAKTFIEGHRNEHIFPAILAITGAMNKRLRNNQRMAITPAEYAQQHPNNGNGRPHHDDGTTGVSAVRRPKFRGGNDVAAAVEV